MKTKNVENKLIVRLEKGEEIVEKLENILAEKGITAGSFQGLGAISRATLGHYSLATKDYKVKEIEKPLELVSLLGTISKEGIHPHACLSDEEMSTFGGHLDEGIVAATCEIIVFPADGTLKRYHDEKIGLDLLDL